MSGALVVRNKTSWSTRDVRRFVLAGLKEEVGDWTRYVVNVAYKRVHAGRGYVGYRELWLHLPNEDCEMVPGDDGKPGPVWTRREKIDGADLLWYAEVLAHEVNHNKGLRHKEMTDAHLDLSWARRLIAEGFAIRRKVVKPKAKRDLVAERSAHAQEKLAEWESKLRRASKKVRHWRGKVRYYERSAARRAAAKPKRREAD